MALHPRPQELQGRDLSAQLAPMDIAGRLGRLRERLAYAAIDALIVTNLTNVRYLSGFTGSAGVLVVTSLGATLITDGRYGTQAPAQVRDAQASVDVEITSDKVHAVIVAALSAAGATRVGLESEAVTWAAQQRYAIELSAFELVASSGVVEHLRLTKDAGELDRMVRAAAIADAAFANVRPMLAQAAAASPGAGSPLTERDFAFALDTEIRRLGASGNSFETIVASGPNGALPHARPTDRPIGRGELVVLDFGARFDGYCSDMTRTVATCAEGELDAQLLAMVDSVAASQRAGVEAVAEGVAVKTVDETCRSVLETAGMLEHFTHGTGHGVGLDIHEAPRVSRLADATLSPGFVVTVEPGVYIAPHGGVRIEDTVVVTESGCWSLTTSPKTLYVA